MDNEINQHYGSDNLKTKIFTALEKSGKDVKNLTLKDLSVIDQLHTGGHVATLELAKKTELPTGAGVLDAGCGIGGSCRLLAREYQFNMTGMDLVPDFIDVAQSLSQSTGMGDSISYLQGDIMDTGLETDSFDAVWCQHTLMNIQDKESVFSEFNRILKPGGILVLHEIVQGTMSPIHLPVPWADRHTISHLMSWPQITDILLNNGFTCRFEKDQTQEQANTWWARVKKAFEKKRAVPSPLGPHIIFGENGISFGNTMTANLEEDRIRLMEAIFVKK